MAGPRGHASSSRAALSAKPARKPSGKKGLDRADVLEAARKLADRTGAAHLSITQLADQLGISPPSIYAHFAGLPELRRELALRGYRELTAHMVQGGFGLAGGDALIGVCNAYLDWIRRFPGLYSAIIAVPYLSDAELTQASREWVGVLFRALSFYGFDTDGVIHASRGLRSIVHGFGSLERDGAFVSGVDRDESFRRVLHSFVEGLRETTRKSPPCRTANAKSTRRQTKA
jgi:AcrR family transcriptional regulator